MDDLKDAVSRDLIVSLQNLVKGLREGTYDLAAAVSDVDEQGHHHHFVVSTPNGQVKVTFSQNKMTFGHNVYGFAEQPEDDETNESLLSRGD